MAGLVTDELADQAVTQQIQVANGVQHLVLDEFVLVTQPVLVEDAILIHHDGIIDTAAQRQILAAQELDIAHETERPGPRHFLHERGRGEIDAGHLVALFKHRVIEFDGEGHLEAIKGDKSR